MRALAKVTPGPGLDMIDVPEPVTGPDDVKIRVRRAGLCGTDLHLHDWDEWAASTVQVPLVLGHEFSGEIVELGDDVDASSGGKLAVGQRVSGEGHVVCGHCRNCRAGRRHVCINTRGIGVHRDGAFADYVVIPATNVWVQPDNISLELAAIFDPFGNATHTALQWPMVGEDVLITGAGPIGVMATAIARHAGARFVTVTDVSAVRLDLATRAGADLVIDSSSTPIRDAQVALGMKEGFDIGLEMSGAPSAVREMLDNMNHGGRVAMLGLPKDDYSIDWARVITHMITIRGIYGRQMFDTWYAMAAMLQTSAELRRSIESVITHVFRADQWREAFDTARSGRCGKVLIDWGDD